MAGAAALVGASALRSGAGLVRVACPAEVQPTVASFEPSYMTYPLANDDDGLIRFEPARAGARTARSSRPTSSPSGPGLGQSDEIRDLVRWVVESVKVPTVLDADALNALAGQTDTLADLRRPVVLTPHPGEFARLTGRTDRRGPGRPRRARRRAGAGRSPGRRPQGGQHGRHRRRPGLRQHDRQPRHGDRRGRATSSPG